jgi:hypothetical protein
VLARHRIIILPSLFRSLERKKKKQKKKQKPKTKNPTPSHCPTRPRQTSRSATPRRRNSKEKTTTQRSRTRWVVPGREGSALLGPKVGRGWPRGYPWSMGRSCCHPRGLGVAFGPILDPSRAGPIATPGSAQPPPATGGWPRGYPRSMGRPRGHPRGLGVAFGPTLDPSRAGPMATPGPARPPPTTVGWPRLGVAFGPTIPSAEWTSIRRRSSVRWRVPTRELAACSGLDGAGSGSIIGVGGVVWSGRCRVVWPGRCRRCPAWLWQNVCLGRGGLFLLNFFEREMGQKIRCFNSN